MALVQTAICDGCGKRDIGLDSTVEYGQAFPKPRLELCPVCRNVLFADLALCLDDQGALWLKEAVLNRREKFAGGYEPL